MDNALTFEKLMQAVAMRESSQNPNAVSDAGAVGLLGIMPGDAMQGMRKNVPTVFEAAEQLGFQPEDRSKEMAAGLLKDPVINSMIGEAYMRELLSKYGGDTEAVLTAYNAGPGKFDRVGSAAGMDIQEQREYAKKVGEDYKNMFGSELPSNLGVLSSPRPKSRPQGLLD